MASDGEPVERLRDYLRTLKPEACAMLVAELERGMLRGDGAGNELVLQELRRAIRAAGQPAARIGDVARLFFAPLEPFLVDDAADHKRVGRIARVSLEPIWTWIARDLMPAEVNALSGDINRALLADDRFKAEQMARALHDRALQRIGDAIAATHDDERARRHLAVQVGTPRALEDLDTLLRVLTIRDVLTEFTRRLPAHIRALEADQIDTVRAALENALALRVADTPAARRTDVYLFGLIAVMGRLAAPWQLVRVATRAAESDNTGRIAETPFAVAVTIVLGEIEAMVRELRTEIKARRPVVGLLRGLHDAARDLRTEIDLAVESPWSRRLAAVRAEVSGLLKAEIEPTSGRVRRLLRPRPAKEIKPGSVLDKIDVDDAEMLVEFVAACRNYAGELAANEVTMRAYSELQQYLETGTKVLLDSLRYAGEADGPFRQSQVDAAIRLCKIVFGADYAALLAKAAEIAAQAAQAAPTERKTARA
jgi:hypothetical protein